MPDKSADLLEKAIDRNVSNVISLPSAGVFRNHKSRFLCNLEDGILLEAPDEDRALVTELARIQKPCGVAFRSGFYRVTFTAPILKIEPRWKLNEHTFVRALLFKHPARVHVTQKRSDYRVEIPSGTEIAVRIWRLGVNDELMDQPTEGREIAAELLDLSNGGIGVKLVGEGDKKPKICLEDRLRILLTFEGEHLILPGRMRRPHVLPEGNTIFTGIQFKKTEIESKSDTQLLRFFVELQRRELRLNKLGMKKSA